MLMRSARFIRFMVGRAEERRTRTFLSSRQDPEAMFSQSIRGKIAGIALGLVVLMIGTSILSMFMANRVGHLLDELTNKYVPAYGDLARTNVRSLERALALRQMVIAKMQTPPDDVAFAQRMQVYRTKDAEVTQEADAARKFIGSILADPSTPSDNVALALIDGRIEAAVTDVRRLMNEENSRLISQLEAHDFPEVQRTLQRSDSFRDEFNQRISQIRAGMLAQVYSSAATVIVDQQRATWITVIVTAIAAILGLLFAGLVGGGITRPVRLLLQGTREVEAGQLDRSIDVVTRDEIGQLTAAFNRMVGQLRHKEQMRRTFGRYIDPRVAEGLINQSAAATEGQRRVMTVMFCDMKGFTRLSEGMTPQGLVKVMNRYLSTMSEPIRAQQGIIDKYIGDAIMAYWGPPFADEADEARLACLAAIDMMDRIGGLRKELPELLGVRTIPTECDLRIGIATGEALVGSIGSEFMMSFTVMGDTVNLASRLESANKLYGTRCLVSQATIAAAAQAVEAREIDRLVVAGQSRPQIVFEIMGRGGELSAEQITLRAHYSEGLAAYRACHWDEATTALKAALAVAPGDGPCMVLLNRVENLRDNPPGADWDGSWRLDQKNPGTVPVEVGRP
jgi:class 3 adenylate cyclase